MSDVLIEAIAELTRQNRELAARVTALENDRTEDRERLNAHGMLLAPQHRIKPVQHYAAMALQVRGEATQ